ncbi:MULTISPECIES: DUF397 domain-containing protein [unclassified Saccharopolyspora]|uniref:DUF397 domain-containing protein n=1 Tax=unclassified Saccharopolyspora TaxID=2646250 RepID=UPI001CD46713|nr:MULTISPECIES: DUF397 domain-containing protein [unclassified Saccharopolyspora]MCA1185544.1 DUF397 domain-containing protein [Saccharopolyspora sp. 6T]MCA1196013.1 DUF397 domain-containing protein [Saccharopolyspora sp. 6V]MCA1228501.1 DUF397 domain-containing protein [Saccharopolyspora sp. 6M]MCA1283063.1 DUF397 domain-containing protein [Saccharopolyspora sp. 7B]
MSKAFRWRKSSYSGNQTNCVEIGRADGRAAIRDTKNRAAGYLVTDLPRWSEFLTAVKTGRYDR